MQTLSSESRSHVATRSFHVRVALVAGARRSSGPAAGRHHARPGGPTDAGLPRCIRASRPPTESSPTVIRAPPRALAPAGRRAHAIRGSTSMVVPWATSSLGIGPPTIPVRFTLMDARRLCFHFSKRLLDAEIVYESLVPIERLDSQLVYH